ncbi:50S ribosomal protein L24 [Buchnera aphidicola (Schlechtendalia chinensis)]|uniref:Large ribosomal subunit protein uL24 n=1 Tax=Buchnera aphidicola subsp. Schlechtendalia chinensis TaxID=118110 RepID=A0A172WE09_BUCSC|nr:50S ribosomal protein L24 [Buchnera aphidicola]ANF17214.1 50S ribosomal protein L24 [Buchnera aphidicola (Schlechtendalia chinensis)]
MAAKIKKNDQVIIITGKEKGTIGIVKKVFPNKRVIIEGVNIVKKHQKPVPSQNIVGGIINKEASIHVSNVAILNPQTKRLDRIGFRIENNKKVRFFKSNNVTLK